MRKLLQIPAVSIIPVHLFLVVLLLLCQMKCAYAQEISPLLRNKNSTNLNIELRPGNLRILGLEEQKQPSNRIIGGDEADPSTYPYFTSLLIATEEEDGNDREWVCGGTLIAPRVVLGAAHCTDLYVHDDLFHHMNISSVRVLGLEGVKDVDVERVEVHPAYDPLQMWNADIALFILKESVDLDFYSILDNSITPEVSLEPEAPLTVIGFGLTEDDAYSDILLETTINFIPHEECQAIYAPHGVVITEYMMCAFSTASSRPQDSCNGDSGGPLMYTVSSSNSADNMTLQLGVVSWGVSCANDQFPAVYSRVSKAMDWITTVINSVDTYNDEDSSNAVTIPDNDETLINQQEEMIECNDVGGWSDIFGDGCEWYANAFGDDDFIYGDDDEVINSGRCEFWGTCCENEGYTALTACCTCGGGVNTVITDAPTPAPTPGNSITTEFSGSSIHSGNMFDILVMDSADILITELQIHLYTSDYSPTIDVWVLSGSTHINNEGNQADTWLLHTSAIVSSNGFRNPTSLQLNDMGLFLSNSNRYAFYITCIDNIKDMVYSIGSERGSVFVSNSNLSLLEGSAIGYPFKDDDLYQPRVWNGSMYYMTFPTPPKPSIAPTLSTQPSVPPPTDLPTNRPSIVLSTVPSMHDSYQPSESPTIQPSPTASERTIVTEYTGDDQMDGIMFNIVHPNIDQRTLYITRMDLHMNDFNSIFHVKVYIRYDGSFEGYERRPGAWTEIGSAEVVSRGLGQPTVLPPGSFNPIELSVGLTYGIYLQAPYASSAMQVTKINGDIWKNNDDIQISVGTGKRYDYYKSYKDHGFNGALHYTYKYPAEVAAFYEDENVNAIDTGASNNAAANTEELSSSNGLVLKSICNPLLFTIMMCTLTTILL